MGGCVVAGGVGFLEGDQAGREVEQGEVVLVLLGPADEDAAVAVHPGVTGLHDPAACPPIGLVNLELDLLTARADMGCEVVVAGQVANLGVVVCLVQADALRPLGCGLRTRDRDRVQRALQQLVVVAVRAAVVEPDGDPRALRDDRALGPFLALSVGFGPVFAPPNGALDIAPSAASHDQSIPTRSS